MPKDASTSSLAKQLLAAQTARAGCGAGAARASRTAAPVHEELWLGREVKVDDLFTHIVVSSSQCEGW